MNPNELLEVIDRTLAAARAAMAAGTNPAESEERRSELSAQAGSFLAMLPTLPHHQQETEAPAGVFDAMRRAQEAANGGDLVEAERQLTAAREQLGGPSV